MEDEGYEVNEMYESVRGLFERVNHFDYQKQAEQFFSAMTRQHRTLQQNFWRMIAKVMAMYGETEYVDLRNEASKEFCKKVSDYVREHGVSYFPTV